MFEALQLACGIPEFRMSKATKQQLPPQCRNCPVMKILDGEARMAALKQEVTQRKAFRALDAVQAAPAGIAGVIAIRQAEADRLTAGSEEASGKKEVAQRSLENALGATDETCPGTRLGDLTEPSTPARLLGMVANSVRTVGLMTERSCTNPRFTALQGDEGVKIALHVGNWAGGTLDKE